MTSTFGTWQICIVISNALTILKITRFYPNRELSDLPKGQSLNTTEIDVIIIRQIIMFIPGA